MSTSRITIKHGKASLTEANPAPDPPPEDPNPEWPYKPKAEKVQEILRRALPHFLAIRAAGSTPLEGGPSFPIATRSREAFEAAAAEALAYWPAATQFEIVGSDSHFPAARLTSDGLPETAILLRLAVVVAQLRTKDQHREAPAGWAA